MELATWVGALIGWMSGLGKPLALGLVMLAAGLSATGYLVVKGVWRFWLIRQWRRRQQRTQRQGGPAGAP
jgi:uncharacterized protein (DUF2062 family)